MELILSLLQQMCVYLVLAYMLSKTPLFLPILSISSHRKHRYLVYVVFSSFCILGTYFGLQIDDAIANTRAIGAVIGGLLGGPVVGFAVGLTGGLHRYSLGGFTDVACAISTTLEGLIGGLMHVYYVRQNKSLDLFNPWKVGVITFVAELFQMAILLTVAEPFEKSYALVSAIAAPMVIANSVGAALFISILSDKKTIFEKYSATFSRRALSIADRSVGVLTSGFTPVNAEKVARIIYEETNVGAVAITDKEKILAFIGTGADHHLPNTPISSSSTMESLNNNKIVHLDGAERPYQCTLNTNCPLGSVLIIPLHSGSEVVGTIKLYEPKRKFMSTVTLSMAEGIAQLLSSQIVYGAYQQQKDLLSQSEIKLLHAQVNPHFLFNALNTISAIIRRDPKRARELVLSLSRFFRINLKQNTAVVTLKEEIDHVNAYLAIEKARFAERLQVTIKCDDAAMSALLPSFTLQPLVENAVKHGIAQRIEGGHLTLNVRCTTDNHIHILVEDNAGLYKPKKEQHAGLGMDIVDKRLIHQFGQQAGLVIECRTNQFHSDVLFHSTHSSPFSSGLTMTKNSAFRALVIDDEPLAREELCQLLNETNEVQVLAEAANAIEGLALIKQHCPDVIFLDIEMPQLSGLDMLAMLDLDTMPYVVLVTAFEQYALQAFEDNAFDYLLKPVEPERLDKTLARLKKRTQPQTDIDAVASPTLVHIPCVGHQRILLLPESDIQFAYSDVAGVHVRSLEQQADTQLTLKTLEERTALVRCHRQYLVRLSCVAEIKLLDNGLATLLMKTGDSVPVSRRYLKKLKSLLTL